MQASTTRGYLQSVEQGEQREGLPPGPVCASLFGRPSTPSLVGLIDHQYLTLKAIHSLPSLLIAVAAVLSSVTSVEQLPR